MTLEKPKELSRGFVDRSIAKLLDEFESLKKWGKVEVTVQAGSFKAIKKEETIIADPSE